jgi:protein-disulfide isomerase
MKEGKMANKKQKGKSKVTKEERREQRTKSKGAKRVRLWLSVVVGLSLLIFSIIRLASSPGVEVSGRPEVSLTEISENEWIKGNPKAKVTLVEYSDFQCPTCGIFYPIVKKMESEFGDQLRVVYRHFPLGMHAYAELAAQAAEAAGKQGKFWQMHDLIFDSQQEWSKMVGSARGKFLGYAKELALDLPRFEADLDSKATRQAVEEARRSGERVGVSSTPTFFLNGVQIKNLRSENELRNLIQKAIAGGA